MNIRILPEAEHDLELGADFYESQRDGLGRYFNECLASDIESLRLYAGTHERAFGLYRCISDRFPFAIFYHFDSDRVDVFAVLDFRQDPESIETRLASN
jgi:plasmid stabilization system protein ParE